MSEVNQESIELMGMLQDRDYPEMDKKQAKIEAKKIFEEALQQIEEITKKAKKDGTWKKGLDANKELFADLDRTTKEKIKRLYLSIDEN